MIVPKVVEKFFEQMREEPWFYGMVVDELSVDSVGNNMLDYAVMNGDAEVIKYLIEFGVDVNNSGEFGYTPLHTCIESEKYDLACYLISMGADGSKRNNDGISAFSMLKRQIFNLSDFDF